MMVSGMKRKMLCSAASADAACNDVCGGASPLVGFFSLAVVILMGCSASSGAAPSNGGDNGSGGSSTATGGGGGQSPAVTGGAGGAPAAGGAPTTTGGGAPTTLPPGDPSVQFDWPEATLGAGLPPCQAGHYQGTFEGKYHSAAFFGVPLDVDINGNIDFTLNQGMNGEFFEISEGHVDGGANASGIVVPFSADIIGTLNCSTGQLEDAGLVNGQYDVATVLNYFEGPVTGTYDRNTSAFTIGTWSVVEPAAPGSGGSGTWQAGWVP
jgi:hypothetical protein